MFDTLIESRPKKKPLRERLPQAMSSLVFHGLVIWGAVVATLGAGAQAAVDKLDTNMVFIAPEEEQQEEEPPPPEFEAPEQTFTSLSAPISIPTNIPPINLDEKFDPTAFSGIGIEKVMESTAFDIDPGQAFIEALVDEKPALISSPSLDYPDLLRQAGIEGTVVLEFIVDTTGHAERNSVRALASTNKAFEVGAINMIIGSLFRPGRVRGQAVRVLVQQPIAFVIDR